MNFSRAEFPVNSYGTVHQHTEAIEEISVEETLDNKVIYTALN